LDLEVVDKAAGANKMILRKGLTNAITQKHTIVLM
jgi:hypothetical protein